MGGQGDGSMGVVLKLGPQHPYKDLIYVSVIQHRFEGMDRLPIQSNWISECQVEWEILL